MITGMIFVVATPVATGSIASGVLDVGNLDYFKFTVNQAATYLTDTSGNTHWYDISLREEQDTLQFLETTMEMG